MAHYLVVSPEMIRYDESGIEPPEEYSCVVEVTAGSQREAKAAALKLEGMRIHIMDARGDGRNPFSGVVAVKQICDHDRCVCSACWTSKPCPDCLRDDDELSRSEGEE